MMRVISNDDDDHMKMVMMVMVMTMMMTIIMIIIMIIGSRQCFVMTMTKLSYDDEGLW